MFKRVEVGSVLYFAGAGGEGRYSLAGPLACEVVSGEGELAFDDASCEVAAANEQRRPRRAPARRNR